METFGDIAARTGLNRDTIRNRHRRLIAAGEKVGIQRDGVWLFDKENAARIDGPLVDNKKQKKEVQPITPHIEPVSDMDLIDTPLEIHSLQLAKSRHTPVPARRLSDPKKLLVVASAIRASLKLAYQNDMDAQFHDLENDQGTLAELQAVLSDMSLEEMEYRISTRLTQQQQNAVTSRLLDAYQKLEALQNSTPPETGEHQ